MRRRDDQCCRPLHLHSPLHRRLLLWFTAMMIVTGCLSAIAVHSILRHDAVTSEVTKAKVFVTNRFSEAWNDPAQRAQVARGLSQDLDLDLVVRDSSGAVLIAEGRPCEHPGAVLPISRDQVPVGTVDVCFSRHRGSPGMAMLVGFLIAVVSLWAGTRHLAWHIARPLRELANVAASIGKGNLSRRAPVDRRGFGEARVLGGVMNEMADRIEKQLADQKTLLAAVSHEIRSPLARMRLLVEMGRDGAVGSKIFDGLDREIADVDTLVSDLLASSRLDFSASARRPLNAAELAAEALNRAGLPQELLQLEGDNTEFEGDATLMSRAIGNLIQNALVHGGGLDRLVVRGSASGVVFEAQDSGPGFGAGEEQKVFEPFYRRAGGSANGGSVGLGLSLVKRIAEAHGGRVWAENREGGGASAGIEIAK